MLVIFSTIGLTIYHLLIGFTLYILLVILLKTINAIKTKKLRQSNDQIAARRKTIDYCTLPQIAEIITNGDKKVYADFKLLAEDTNLFVDKYKTWCQPFIYLNDKYSLIFEIFTHWLTGDDTTFTYGAYIDYKAETDDIVYFLNKAIEKLDYPLTLEKTIVDAEHTNIVLSNIDSLFQEKGYRLIDLDTGDDSYCLFIVTNENFETLKKLGSPIDFNFGTITES